MPPHRPPGRGNQPPRGGQGPASNNDRRPYSQSSHSGPPRKGSLSGYRGPRPNGGPPQHGGPRPHGRPQGDSPQHGGPRPYGRPNDGPPPQRSARPGGRPTGGPAPGRPRPEARPAGARPTGARRPVDAPGGEDRLQKILAHAGIGSRRACEDLIRQGRVTIGGQVVKELGTKVDPSKTFVAVDGQKIQAERPVYFAVNKPKGFVSTNNDPAGRPRVLDILPEVPQRVYTVGRLDEMSVGLLLLTNDGELANKLAHPKFGVEKLYRVIVAGFPEREVLNQLTEGIWLAEGKVRAKRVRTIAKKGDATILELVLAEGKNREVRRMLAKLGHKVMSLTRVAVGPITLKGLMPGHYRPLTGREVDLLRRVAAGESVPMPWAADRRPHPGDDRRPRRPDGPPLAADYREPGRPARPGQDRPGSTGMAGPRPGMGGGPRRFDDGPRPGPGNGPRRFDDGPRRFDDGPRRHDDGPRPYGPRHGGEDRRDGGRPPRPAGPGGPPRRPGMFQAPLDETMPRSDARPIQRPNPYADRSQGGPRLPLGVYGSGPFVAGRTFDDDRPAPTAGAEAGSPPRPRPGQGRKPAGHSEPRRKIIGLGSQRPAPPVGGDGEAGDDRPKARLKRPAPRAGGKRPGRPAPRRRPDRGGDD